MTSAAEAAAAPNRNRRLRAGYRHSFPTAKKTRVEEVACIDGQRAVRSQLGPLHRRHSNRECREFAGLKLGVLLSLLVAIPHGINLRCVATYLGR
jgi:hypothetical protein